LVHAHFRVWEWVEKNTPRKFSKPLIIVGYLPLTALPWVVIKLWSDPYQEPTEKLAPLLLPFILWFVLIFIE
jgi:hypothetical protein